MFEKYWSKPTKRKGVVIEEPNNPSKDSMTKLGTVTITVEPHVFDAVMYAVKDPKPHPPPPTIRPVLQYGPPGGVMPPAHLLKDSTPKPSPSTATATPSPSPGPTRVASPSQAQAPAPAVPVAPPAAQAHPESPPSKPPLSKAPSFKILQFSLNESSDEAPTRAPPPLEPPRPPPVVAGAPQLPVASPRGMESVLNNVPPRPPHTLTNPAVGQPVYPHPAALGGPIAAPAAPPRPAPASVPVTAPATTAPKPPGTDPIILTLAEKAGEDPHLRDLMKRVAQGDAAKHELERFQAIIDAITQESKRKGAPVGPSADRLLVDGRTVRYFADEVRAILDIVLSSNPKQTSADLRPPVGSDPLVVALVKAALDDRKTADVVRRIAGNRPLFSDATELKVVLDRLRAKLLQEREAQRKAQSPQAPPSTTAKPQGTPNGHAAPAAATPNSAQQALRSKGPPPVLKPDISAIVFEFGGGSGDRFLFPKFSIVEHVPTPNGQQVIASFLIVRKGSKSEYPKADPELDYYQPITIRLFTPHGRHLDNLARVVAPQEEVRRYMDDVMDKMTRAEYVLLAMRLPRGDAKEDEAMEDKDKEDPSAPKQQQGETEPATAVQKSSQVQPMAVLWGTSKTPKSEGTKPRMYNRVMDVEDQQYQNFVSSVSRKERREA